MMRKCSLMLLAAIIGVVASHASAADLVATVVINADEY